LKWLAKEAFLRRIVDFVINNNHSKQPCYGQLKLSTSYHISHHYIFSLFVCFGRPPTTMDAVLATIVVGGQAMLLK
jgi:hypothetical protein